MTGLLRSSTIVLPALTFTVLGAAAAVAQDGYVAKTRLELRTGYDTERKAGVLGAGARFARGRFEVIPAIDYYFVDPGSAWQGNLDVAFRVDRRGLLYVGTGAAIVNRKSGGAWFRDVGWNLFAGLALEPEGGTFGLFAEPRWTFTEGPDGFYFAIGVTIGL